MAKPTVTLAGLRNLVLSLAVALLLFGLGTWTIISLLPRTFLSPQVPRLNLSIELAGLLMLYVAPLAIILGFLYMYFFGGILSTYAIQLYLMVMRGKHTLITNRDTSADRPWRLDMKLQGLYSGFILAVVVSFAMYLAKERQLPFVATLTRTHDVAASISQDFVTLVIIASLMVPIVALALPYFSGAWKVRSIDTGKFHTTVISLTISASGGFSLIYTLLQRPEILSVLFYTILLLGVSWCFALGCNLATDSANRNIQQNMNRKKQESGSRLLTSTIMLRDFSGKLIEA